MKNTVIARLPHGYFYIIMFKNDLHGTCVFVKFLTNFPLRLTSKGMNDECFLVFLHFFTCFLKKAGKVAVMAFLLLSRLVLLVCFFLRNIPKHLNIPLKRISMAIVIRQFR